MRAKSVTLYRIRLPFRRPVEHASAFREFSDNLLIHFVSTDGAEGWGETIAREYVTGDTTDSVLERILAIPPSTWDKGFDSAEDVVQFHHDAGLADANVARCAVELALLDVQARRANQPLHRFLSGSWPHLAQIRNQPPFRYSGPIGILSPVDTFVAALKLRLFQVRTVKIKLSRDAVADRRRLKIARAVLGSRTEIRVDPNESWTFEHACLMTPILRRFGVTSVEQPFHKTRLDEARKFSNQEDIPIIFDESLCSDADAEALVRLGIPAIFAVKLAKLGGFLSTLRVLDIAARNRIPVQISCQVGESAILSAAGRHLAMVCPNLRHLEGSYDRFMLSANVISGDISVGKGGLAPALTGPGLGISVDNSAVERLATEKHSLFP